MTFIVNTHSKISCYHSVAESKENETIHSNTKYKTFISFPETFSYFVFFFCCCLFLLFTISNTKSPLKKKFAPLLWSYQINSQSYSGISLKVQSIFGSASEKVLWRKFVLCVYVNPYISIIKVLDEYIKSCEWKNGYRKEVK